MVWHIQFIPPVTDGGTSPMPHTIDLFPPTDLARCPILLCPSSEEDCLESNEFQYDDRHGQGESLKYLQGYPKPYLVEFFRFTLG
jgi:hypothetical protein